MENHTLLAPKPPICSAQFCGSDMDRLGRAGSLWAPVPSSHWSDEGGLCPTAKSPSTTAAEVRRHPGDTLAGVWGDVHTTGKREFGCSGGGGASMSYPLLPCSAVKFCVPVGQQTLSLCEKTAWRFMCVWMHYRLDFSDKCCSSFLFHKCKINL